MHLRDYLRVLRQHWTFITAVTVVGLALGLVSGIVQPPTYSATTRLFISTPEVTNVTDLSIGASFTQQAVKSYATVAESRLVLSRVKSRLGLTESVDRLQRDVSTEVPLDTAVLEVSVHDRSPATAADIANEISAQLSQVVVQLSATATSDAVKVTQIDEAVAEPRPIAPILPINALAGVLAGAICGFLVSLLRNLLETRPRSEKEIEEATQLPVLGTVLVERRPERRVLDRTGSDQHTGAGERYRTLRTNLQFFDAGRLKSFVVTSTTEAEGKSTTAVNLAMVTSGTASSVVLVDADLRRPSVASLMELEGGVGLTEVLIGRATLDEALQTVTDGSFTVLPSGSLPPNPSELLQSDEMADLVRNLQERFEVVIFDTPPVLPVTDAMILGKSVGGVLFVCAAGRARRAEITRALALLRNLDIRILGAVASMLPRGSRRDYGSYYSLSSAPTVQRPAEST